MFKPVHQSETTKTNKSVEEQNFSSAFDTINHNLIHIIHNLSSTA